MTIAEQIIINSENEESITFKANILNVGSVKLSTSQRWVFSDSSRIEISFGKVYLSTP